MKKYTLLALCFFFLSLLSSSAANLYLIGNTSSAWTTSAVTGFTVYKVDLSNSGTNGTTAVSLTQWLTDRNLATPTYLIGGSAGAALAATDQVWIAKGTYNVSTVWAPTTAASIFGGFAGGETATTGRSVTNVWDFSNETIISGSAANAISCASNRTFTIDGLSFTAFSQNPLNLKGGTTVQNCKFYANSVNPIAIYINYSTTATLTVQYCKFYNNTGSSTTYGSYGIVTQTGASSAGGMTVDINNCTFDGNKNNGATSSGQSGAIQLTSSGSGTGLIQKVANCTFLNNECINTLAGSSAMSCMAGATGSITVTNCLFYTNGTLTANSKPALYLSSAGTSNCTIGNNTVVNNVSGGAYIANNVGVNVFNTLFWGTDGGSMSGSGYVNCAGTSPTLINCAYNAKTSGTSTNAIILPYNNTTGTNAPFFVDPTTNNWQLSSASSIINKGDGTIAGSPAKDLLGTTRPQPTGGIYDIGAYEFVDNSSITNAGFEDAVGNFTVVESAANVLMRIGNVYDATTQIVNPTATAISNANGLWVKKCASTGYVKGVVVTSDKHSGTSSLNFKYQNGLNYGAGFLLNMWNAATVSQKVSTLSNANKYIISFWAKADGTSPNAVTNVTAFICENSSSKAFLSCAIPLTGGTTWTQYSAIFDVPTFKVANSSADFTTAYVGVGLTTTFDPTTFKTNYSGVLLDDFSVSATSTGTVSISTSASTGGTVTGTGAVYVSGTSATVVAAPTLGYSFVNWTESGTPVSTSASYTFTATTNRTLVANFVATSVPISQSSLSGFNYNVGSGPSSEQSFTVGGTNLTSNIVITPPTDFEISKTSGSGYQSSAITLTASSGSVSTTTIYVRLKSGLAVNSYSSENITVAVMGSSQTVACSGSVSKITPTLSLASPSVSYTGSAQSATVNSSVAGAVSNVLYNSSATAPTAVGTYPVIADFVPTDGTNYNNLTGASAGTFTISPISQTVSSSGSIGSSSSLPGTDITVNSGVELTVDNTSTVRSITVAPGGKLTLNDTFGLTATNGIVLQNNASGTASFVDNRTADIPSAIAGTVQQAITESNRNWYVAVPVLGLTNTDITLSGAKIVKRNEVNLSWDDVTGSLTAGVGYIAVASSTSGSTTWSLAGNLNSGKVQVGVTQSGASSTGFNLLGNPYPSYLNWEQVLNLDATNASLLQSTIWYRTATYNSGTSKFDYTFNTYNSAGRVGTPASTTGYIPPMQAFWVRANTAGTVTFTNAMRSHGDGASNKLKAPKVIINKIIRLEVSNNINKPDETVMYFDENAQNSFDSYDSQKFSNNPTSSPEIFTLAGTEQLVINGMKTVPLDQEIPLGLNPGNSSQLSIYNTELSNFEAGTQVLLRDYQDPNNVVEKDLTNGGIYSFTSASVTTTTNRFALVLKSPSVNTELSSNYNELNISVFKNSNGEITVSCPIELTGKAITSVFNSIGQKLETKKLNSNVTVLSNAFKSGVYFVNVVANGKTTTQKVVVN